MRTAVILAVLALAAVPAARADDAKPAEAAAPAKPAPPKKLTPAEVDKALYAVGLAVARSLEPFDLSSRELDKVVKGLKDAHAGKPAIKLAEYDPMMQRLVGERRTAVGEKLKAASTAFVAKAQTAKGAVTTGSGLVYVPLKEGTGAQPGATDQVKVHYTGKLTDGKVFDSSFDRGEPATFPLNRVIKCWTEGVQMMKVGGKARLVCPAEIAYGERGGGPIPPNATLDFQVELLDVMKAPPPAPAPDASLAAPGK
jgi:FKBP-type peptidyl-prolyl cis-trans isomerase